MASMSPEMNLPHRVSVEQVQGRRWLLTVLLVTFMASSSSTLPFVSDSVAAILQLATIPLLGVALFLTGRAMTRGDSWSGSRLAGLRTTTMAVVIAVIVAGAIVASTTVTSTNRGTQVIPDSFALTVRDSRDSQAQVVPVDRVTIDLDDEQEQENVYDKAQSIFEAYDRIEGGQRERLVAAAKSAGYEPQSGLTLDWSNVVTEANVHAQLVTVPLLGTDIPELTKVVFVHQGDVTTVFEWVAQSVGEGISASLWENGMQVNSVLFELRTDGDSMAAPAGIDWGKWKYCMVNKYKFGQAVINAVVAVCGTLACRHPAACAACVSFAAGMTTGKALDCAEYAWS